MLTDGLWIIVMFLSDSLSDGTHSLQSIHWWDTDEMLQTDGTHSLLSNWCDAAFLRIWWRHKLLCVTQDCNVVFSTSVQVSIPITATVSGGNLEEPYKAVQFHLHWGTGGGPGSEHTVDGEQYPMEVRPTPYQWKTPACIRFTEWNPTLVYY